MKCPKCNLQIIEEELETHSCFSRKIKGIIFDSDSPSLSHIFDGKKWVKCPNFKPSTDWKHDKYYRQGNRTCLKVLST